MTSNMGAHIIQENFENMDMNAREQVLETTKIEVLGLLKKTIRPEFLNRIDEIIMFTPLNQQEVRSIVELQVDALARMLKEKNIELTWTEEALDSLAEKGFNPQFGARPIKRVIQKEVLNSLSKELLKGNITASSRILLDTTRGPASTPQEYQQQHHRRTSSNTTGGPAGIDKICPLC